MPFTTSEPILGVVQQHVDEAIGLWDVRSTMLKSPLVTLESLAQSDSRIAAHLDGLSIAGDHAWPLCEAALASPSSGSVFTASVCAIDRRNTSGLNRLLAMSRTSADARRGLTGACGWLDPGRLQGIVAPLLVSDDPSTRALGIAVCDVHRVDPGLLAGPWIRDAISAVRQRALRAAGELGLSDLIPACLSALRDDDDEQCRLWAAWSAVLLGDQNVGRAALAAAGSRPGAHRARAFNLSLQAMTPHEGHLLLQGLTGPHRRHPVVQGSGIVGDPAYVPWLISQMEDPDVARIAGESYSVITGADLAALGLDCTPPMHVDAGPNEDPEDGNVELDADAALPWPDPDKVHSWWKQHAHRFQPGTRYFMGAPVTREHCIDVLKSGYQRQRILAAHYLCLLNPGTPLFNTSAPAWRQQRLLAEMK